MKRKKPYENKIECGNNFIGNLVACGMVLFSDSLCGISKIKSQMIVSELGHSISFWWIEPFLWIRIKWFYGFCFFIFSNFIQKISKWWFVQRGNASHYCYQFRTGNSLKINWYLIKVSKPKTYQISYFYFRQSDGKEYQRAHYLASV